MAVAGLRALLSSFLEGALYKYSERMNEHTYTRTHTRRHTHIYSIYTQTHPVADPGGQIRPWPPPSKLAMEFAPPFGTERAMVVL